MYLEFSNIDGELICPATIASSTSIFAPLINGNAFGCDGIIQGAHIVSLEDIYTPLLTCGNIECAENITSQNITTMMNNITLLTANLARATGTINSLVATINTQTTYINKCRLFFESFKDAIFIENEPESGLEFNYDGLTN